MNQAQAKATKGTVRVFLLSHLLVASVLLTSCPEPPKKPIPPLKPAAAEPENGTPLQTVTAPAAPGTVNRMSLGDLYQLVQNNAAVIYDVRPAIIHKMGNIPGSISWPAAAFDRDLARHEPRIRAAIAQSTPVVIYCTDLACPDAVSVATRLAQRGHSVSVLQGGYEAWRIAAP